MPSPASPVDIAYLLERGLLLELHCHDCARYAELEPASLGLPPETIVPSLRGRFKCSRCGSKKTEARPHYGRPILPAAS